MTGERRAVDDLTSPTVNGATRPRTGYVYLEQRRCKGCRAVIHWWETVAGKPSPHDPDGVSHFATCPVQSQFRKGKS